MTLSHAEMIVDSNDTTASYDAVRQLTEKLCLPLVIEDFVVQSMPDVSPTKWHLVRTPAGSSKHFS